MWCGAVWCHKAARRFIKELRILSQYSSFVKLMATAALHGGGSAFRFREQAQSYALLRVFGAARTWSEEQKDAVVLKAEDAVHRAGLKVSSKIPGAALARLRSSRWLCCKCNVYHGC